MRTLWLSSGEKVMNSGVPYFILNPCVWKRMIRLVSCVPGNLREACSIFFKSMCADSERPSTYLTLVMSPFTAFFLPPKSV